MICSALLAGCADRRGGTVPYNVANFGSPDAPTAVSLSEDYKIAPMDTLKITVFQVPDLSGEYEVDLTGAVSLPLIGSVKAIDKTARQLQEEIRNRYHPRYLNNPGVAVAVKASTRHSVTVDGSVRQPGMYPVTGPLSLLQAIAIARGTDENANPRRVAIFRQIEGRRVAAAFDLVSIRRGQAEDPRIYSGDIVVVDGSKTKEVQRNLLQTIPILGIFNPF